LEELPQVMRASTRRANQYERAVLDLVEAVVLRSQVGRAFPAMVVEVSDRNPRDGEVMVREPAVEAPVRSAGPAPLPLGVEAEVRLVEADPGSRKVRFEL